MSTDYGPYNFQHRLLYSKPIYNGIVCAENHIPMHRYNGILNLVLQREHRYLSLVFSCMRISNVMAMHLSFRIQHDVQLKELYFE